jgi:hypothetical protein
MHFNFELITDAVMVSSAGDDQVVSGQHLLVGELPRLFHDRYGGIPEKIYVRPCYRELYAIASDYLLTRHRSPVALFSGVPGIGKSMFLLYFIYRFLIDDRFEDKRFALEFATGEYFMFEPVMGDSTFSFLFRKCTLSDKDFLVLCDISSLSPPESRAKWTCIFSSPNPVRFKEIMKNAPQIAYTLPTWSEVELRFLDPDIARWRDAFALYGGVPRHVFDATNKSKQELSNALVFVGARLMDSYLNARLEGNLDSEECYMLVHMNPPIGESGAFEYSGLEVCSFSSEAIFQRLVKMLCDVRGWH